MLIERLDARWETEKPSVLLLSLGTTFGMDDRGGSTGQRRNVWLEIYVGTRSESGYHQITRLGWAGGLRAGYLSGNTKLCMADFRSKESLVFGMPRGSGSRTHDGINAQKFLGDRRCSHTKVSPCGTEQLEQQNVFSGRVSPGRAILVTITVGLVRSSNYSNQMSPSGLRGCSVAPAYSGDSHSISMHLMQDLHRFAPKHHPSSLQHHPSSRIGACIYIPQAST